MSENRVQRLLNELEDVVPPVLFRTWCTELAIMDKGEQGFSITLESGDRIAKFRQEMEPLLSKLAGRMGIPEAAFSYSVAAKPKRIARSLATFLQVEVTPVTPPPETKEASKHEAATESVPSEPSTSTGTDAQSPEPPMVTATTAMRVGYAEGNLTRFPFTLASDRKAHAVKEIFSETLLRTPQGESLRRWRVTPGASGMPVPFDLAVFRALEGYVLDNTIRRGRYLDGPVFFHISEIIDRMGYYYNWENVSRVSRTFDRLQELSIEQVGCWRYSTGKGKKKPRRRRGDAKREKIHIISSVKAAGLVANVRAPGAVDGTYAVHFSPEYEDSVNDGYVRPIDWDLWINLQRPTSRRLVEILDMDFYGIRNAPYKPYGVSDIASLVPISDQRYLSDTLRTLGRAHEELLDWRYLTVELDRKAARFPRFLYRPGQRWVDFQVFLGHRGEKFEEAKKLAHELGEPWRTPWYHRILQRAPSECVNEALKDLRALRQRPRNQAAWFTGALKAIMKGRGVDIFPVL